MTLEEFNIESEQITVNQNGRIYTATWSYEAVQDLNAQYNIDAAAMLADIIVAELTAEIDREILNDLEIAATVEDTRTTELRDLYFSEEAHADILAWTGGGVLGHGPIRNRTQVVEKIN